MLISHKHKFVSLAIPKTGTRSMRMSLGPLNIIDIVGRAQESEDNPFFQHNSANHAQKHFEKFKWKWSDYYTWIICRNPWDRYFSFFKYFKEYKDKYLRRDKSIPWGDLQVNQGKHCVNLFKNRTDIQALDCIIASRPAQDYYYLNKDGDIIVSHIAKFENLNQEFKDFCKVVGVNPPELAHGNKSGNNFKMHDLYNQKLIDKVAEKEKHIIELKGYQFKP